MFQPTSSSIHTIYISPLVFVKWLHFVEYLLLSFSPIDHNTIGFSRHAPGTRPAESGLPPRVTVLYPVEDSSHLYKSFRENIPFLKFPQIHPGTYISDSSLLKHPRNQI